MMDEREPRPSVATKSPFPPVVRRIAFAACLAAAATAAWTYRADLGRTWEAWSHAEPSPAGSPPRPSRLIDHGEWDGLVTLSEHARRAMGVVVAPAQPQAEPIRFELLGTSEYDSDTLSRVRPMFKGRVDAVHKTVGEVVRKGEPLVELYSTELAEAKSDYEVKHIQWIYDDKLLKAREPLLKAASISQQLFEETKSTEMKSRRGYEVARDKLLVYGLTEEEVGLVEDESGSQKAKMTLRSPASGIVISRDVVVGNLYDEDDTLLIVAPLDHLWIWGNVFESDIDLVKLGQSWEVDFPFLNYKLHGKVEYISNRVDPGTHAVRVRTSVPNPDGRLKADMLVRGLLDVPPVAGWTVIPRTALIVADRRYYIFVRVAGRSESYERRSVEIAQEKDDLVVVQKGLRAGEEVVGVGGLLLAQMYDDLKTTRTGTPVGAEPSLDAP